MAIQKIKILGAVLELPAKHKETLNSTANLPQLAHFLGKLAALAVLFSW